METATSCQKSGKLFKQKFFFDDLKFFQGLKRWIANIMKPNCSHMK